VCVYVRARVCVCVCVRVCACVCACTCVHFFLVCYTYMWVHGCISQYLQHPCGVATIGTGWRRLIGSPKLQIIFHKRATQYRSLLRKMTYKDKGSYESSPPCRLLKWWGDYFLLHVIVYLSITANPTWGDIFESSKLKARTSLLTCFNEKRPWNFELWALKLHLNVSPQVGLAVHITCHSLSFH